MLAEIADIVIGVDSNPAPSHRTTVPGMGAMASYVIRLLSEILEAEPGREKTYPWALGDVSPKTGRAARLPFDAVWEDRKLIIEVDEDQHWRPVKFWDKADMVSRASGRVHRPRDPLGAEAAS